MRPDVRVARVRSRRQFAALRSAGRRSRRRSIQVTAAAPLEGAPPVAAVAYAIGRPVGTAVVRNRLRRRLRALIAELAPPPGTYLVIATPAAATRSFAELRDELGACLDEVRDHVEQPVRNGRSA